MGGALFLSTPFFGFLRLILACFTQKKTVSQLGNRLQIAYEFPTQMFWNNSIAFSNDASSSEKADALPAQQASRTESSGVIFFMVP